ncbi:MAG: hypothetical protein AWU57_297 [Marinobacter sp. T13-3]|nr:MAG: hypothetical protein AWU57_297 [Marinobacter sp. T13-3]
MTDTTKNAVEDLGRALSALHDWYSSTDIEALQTLLCIHMLADQNGYAQLAEVRREVGTQPDRMTRCIRLLMGRQKSRSLSILGSDDAQRKPLVDCTSYEDAPTVKVVALTPKGRDIVERILEPLVQRENRAQSLESKLDKQQTLKATIEKLGFDADTLLQMTKDTGNRIFTERANSMLRALLQDLAELSPQQLYALGLPRTQQYLMEVPGFSPDAPDDTKTDERMLGFNWAMIRHTRTDQRNDKE